ncbi:hypothetical protein CCYA_CCYA10G2950 [Cyanidiococcus yangmingshanensis]|nr:hypothetical protein CCYA_CCYA10G2950 [Cyanidiococcus yangmingshanensis]
MVVSLSNPGRFLLSVCAGATVFRNPARADLVAALGENLPGTEAVLRGHLKRLEEDDEGKLVLRERPLVTSRYREDIFHLSRNTLGGAYYAFLQKHGFVSSERPEATFFEDPNVAYVMQRYRDLHDIWHVLTNLPPTLLGEVALKYFEALHTGLPVAVIAATIGPLRLNSAQRIVLFREYMPWARVSAGACANLMGIYFERRWHTPLVELRRELQLIPFQRKVSHASEHQQS